MCKERPTLTWRFANHWYLVIYDHIKNQVMYAKQDSPMLNKIFSKLPQSWLVFSECGQEESFKVNCIRSIAFSSQDHEALSPNFDYSENCSIS